MIARPTGLTILCVIALMLGSLGGLMFVGSTIAYVFQTYFSSSLSPEQLDLKKQLSEGLGVWSILNTLLWIAHPVVCGMLLTAGVAGWRLTRHARKWIQTAMIAGFFFEILRLGPSIATQVVMMDFMAESMSAAGSAGPAGLSFYRIWVAATVAMLGALFLAKFAFYGWGWWYITRPSMRHFMDGEEFSDDELAEDALADG